MMSGVSAAIIAVSKICGHALLFLICHEYKLTKSTAAQCSLRGRKRVDEWRTNLPKNGLSLQFEQCCFASSKSSFKSFRLTAISSKGRQTSTAFKQINSSNNPLASDNINWNYGTICGKTGLSTCCTLYDLPRTPAVDAVSCQLGEDTGFMKLTEGYLT